MSDCRTNIQDVFLSSSDGHRWFLASIPTLVPWNSPRISLPVTESEERQMLIREPVPEKGKTLECVSGSIVQEN